MENNEHPQENIKSASSEVFSSSWYPTQCEIGSSSREVASTSGNGSLTSQNSYRVLKTDTEDDMVMIQQENPEQKIQRHTSYVVNLGNKFTDQQVKVLMKTWKELYDRRQHIRTSEGDWHDITDKVNMAPGCAKTVKQVKKKFKNLRDRYRASKMKNKKRNFGFSKSISFSQFELVYGNMDKQDGRRITRDLDEDELPNIQSHTVVTNLQTTGRHSTSSEQGESQRKPKELNDKLQPFSHSQSQSFVRPHVTNRTHLVPGDLSTTQNPGMQFNYQMLHPTPQIRSTYSLDVNEFRPGVNNSSSPVPATTAGPRSSTGSESGIQDSQLVNAVRELQQQQITMQRELMRSMKQMEERILAEVSSKVRESEDRFRQQIANALTQLGNLIRIT